MYEIIREDVRPTLDVPFVTTDLINLSTMARLHLATMHSDKFISIDSSNSPDGLTCTTTARFKSKDAFFEFSHDPIVMEHLINKHDEYNNANSIVRSIKSAKELN